MKTFIALTSLVALAVCFPASGWAQASNELKDLKKDIDALKAGQTGIQKELQEIKGLLRQAPGAGQARPQAAAPAQPQNVVLSVEGAPFKGQKDAKVTLIEFTDFQ